MLVPNTNTRARCTGDDELLTYRYLLTAPSSALTLYCPLPGLPGQPTGSPSHLRMLRACVIGLATAPAAAALAPTGVPTLRRARVPRHLGMISSSSPRPAPLAVSADSVVLLSIGAAIAAAHPVPRADLFFAVAYPCYMALTNEWRFGGNVVGVHREFVPLLREGSGPWFMRYVKSFALVSLLLPLPIVFGCFGLGVPLSVSRAAAPHHLLVLTQCACESLTRSPSVAALVRLLIPIGFGAYRMGSLVTWARAATATAIAAGAAAPAVRAWHGVGLCLALANLLMWSYNLFVFLLWRTLPQYLDRREFPTPATRWRGSLLPDIRDSIGGPGVILVE